MQGEKEPPSDEGQALGWHQVAPGDSLRLPGDFDRRSQGSERQGKKGGREMDGVLRPLLGTGHQWRKLVGSISGTFHCPREIPYK